MPVEQIPPPCANKFTASKVAWLFKYLKQLQFNGQLVLISKEQKWTFYLYLGCITYATGGSHPVRRWARNLATYCPWMSHLPSWQRSLSSIDATAFPNCWEYQLLCLWILRQKITREQATEVIQAVVTEVLFDVAPAMDLTYQVYQNTSLSTQLILIDAQDAIAKVQQLWQVWWKAKLADYSPNMAAVIKQPEQLREHVSAPIYKTLTNLLNGQKTLRDLAVQIKRDVVQLSSSLLPYIQLGWVELISIDDLPTPGSPLPAVPSSRAASQGPLVACVDDSLWVCQEMENLLRAAGYRFVGVNDALRSLAILLAHKPDLIFLDLVMPNTNGYEICTQLRKVSCFRNTPIVILSGNDGIVDQVRARLVGATDFLSKPIDAERVFSTINKHLKQDAFT